MIFPTKKANMNIPTSYSIVEFFERDGGINRPNVVLLQVEND
jgi:hypothetical protein